jgi:trigger factor
MKAIVEPLEGNKVKLSVTVDEGEFEKAMDSAFRKMAREVRIPGFRPGKAPRKLLEARIGREAARQEAIRDSLPEFYARALRENDVDAIAQPEIDITSSDDDQGVTFDAVVDVRPQVSVAGYQGLEVTVPSPVASEDEVDRQLDRLRGQFAELNPVDRAAGEGDFVSVDIKGTQDGEDLPGLTADDYMYEVGSGSIAPEVDENLRGAKVGDILEFTAAFGDDEVALRILVKDVKERVLPEVTDDWASEASEFDTVEELRADLRKRLSVVKKVQTQLSLRDQAVDALAQLVAEDPPDVLVESELERRAHDLVHRLEQQGASVEQWLAATGRGEDDVLGEMRVAAAQAVKADLALRALAEAESIEVTDEDIDAEIARLAERYGRKPADLRKQLDRADQLPAVRSDVRKAKALEWLVENVQVVDEDGNPVDRADLTPPDLDGDSDDTEDSE